MCEIAFMFMGFVFGAIAIWITANPMNSFDAGYKAAEKVFSDWDQGFQAGYQAAIDEINISKGEKS